MRILHINDILAPHGGVETYLLALLPRLVEAGHEPHMAFGRGDDRLWPNAHQIPGIGQAQRNVEPDVRRQVASLIKQLAPDLVHLHGIQNRAVYQTALDLSRVVMTAHDYRSICPASNLFFKRTGRICPRVCGPGCFPATALFHCMTPRPSSAWYFYRRARYVMANAPRFAKVISPCDWTAQRFRLAGFAEAQLAVNPYFCSLEPQAEPRKMPPAPTITFLGRGTRTKGWEDFVVALGLLPGVLGLVVGSFDSTAKRLWRFADRHHCADRLELRPWADREAIGRLFAETTVFVFPSRWPETLGIVGLEAMACGVPVVASDVGGVRQWLRNGENGFLVPPRSPAAIADRVRELIEDPRMNYRFGCAGLDTIRERFLPHHHYAQLLDVYEAAARD